MRVRRRPAALMRRMPLVFRASAALLLVFVTGQFVQGRTAGSATYQLMGITARLCPSAGNHLASPSVADGARLIDRAAYRWMLDRVDAARAGSRSSILSALRCQIVRR